MDDIDYLEKKIEKLQKQKELLEDSGEVYRLIREPSDPAIERDAEKNGPTIQEEF